MFENESLFVYPWDKNTLRILARSAEVILSFKECMVFFVKNCSPFPKICNFSQAGLYFSGCSVSRGLGIFSSNSFLIDLLSVAIKSGVSENISLAKESSSTLYRLKNLSFNFTRNSTNDLSTTVSFCSTMLSVMKIIITRCLSLTSSSLTISKFAIFSTLILLLAKAWSIVSLYLKSGIDSRIPRTRIKCL